MKAIIFDCDGTIVDSEYCHFLAWKHSAACSGYELTHDEYHQFVGRSNEANAMFLAGIVGTDPHELILKNKSDHFHGLQKEGISPIKATVDFIHHLGSIKKERGFKMAVASAVGKEEILRHLHHLEIDHYFDLILSGADDLSDYHDPEGVNKPKPYIYLEAAKLLHLKPSDCVVIEDSLTGVKAAVSAGCFTIAVPNQYTKRQDLSLANIRLDSFAGLDIESFLKLLDSN